MALTERNNVSIAQIIFFIPFLFTAIFLCIRHGFGRDAGWLVLVIFSLARLIGASAQLATISDPTNITLYTISLVLQSIGLSIFLTVLFALLSRTLSSIHKARSTVLNPFHLRVIHLAIVASIVLGIIGGSNSAQSASNGGVYTPSNLSQAAVIVTIVVYVILVAITVLLWGNISYAEPGENRTLIAVSASLPILLIRIIYSAVSILAQTPSFNQLTGSDGIFVGLEVIPELVIVLIIEAVGLTLPIRSKNDSAPSGLRRQGTYSRVSAPPVPDHEMHHMNQRDTAYV
ncbi:hypothetical protein F4861DRAFT_221861 [Xylaria intraflava]|nr:hypothetical protein F4861DRAFT_221861 [Xylaria intraflava]